VIPVTSGSKGRRGQWKCKVCAEKVKRTSEGVERKRLIGRNHFPYVIPVTPSSKGRRGQRKCKVCAEKVKRTSGGVERKYTTVYCKQCDVPLCLGECFEAFHSKERYWLVH